MSHTFYNLLGSPSNDRAGLRLHRRLRIAIEQSFYACFFATVCLSTLGVASAQNNIEPKRYKHEKHGAIVFASGTDYELKCDIYQPIADEPRPIMLAIHGGAWTTGSKFAMFRHARILANRGYVVMALNYRLAPQHKWPAQIHDCKHAVRWIREHAAQYNADPERVYAFGYSAGGHLAAMLATTDKDDGLEGESKAPYAKHSSRIQGLIAGGAPTEFSWIGETDTTLKYWLGQTKKKAPEIYANASPITFLTKDDPAMVLFHGSSDGLVPVSSPRRFVERCREANVAADLLERGGGHALTFTLTNHLIDSLKKLELMIAESKCRKKIAKFRHLVNSFVKANGTLPDSHQELQAFAIGNGTADSQSFNDFALNERDGKPFEIRWSSNDGVIISEAVGIDGNVLSSRNQ